MATPQTAGRRAPDFELTKHPESVSSTSRAYTSVRLCTISYSTTELAVKPWYSASVLWLAVFAGFGFAPGCGEATAADEQVITPVEGVKKFTVTGKATKFRILVQAMGGTEIKQPRITGKAKLVRSTDIVRVSEEGPMIGAIEREFEFVGTAPGESIIEVVRIEPSSPKAITETYTVTIE
jgi:hypothetical protein